MKNKLNITTFLLLLSTLIYAQDKIADQLIQRNGNVIVCEIREIGDDEIKYVMEGYRDDLVFGIDKNKVEKIIFGDGREMNIEESMYGKGNYEDQKKNALKFYLFSPLSDATAFGYERSIRPGRSFEVTLGIIGLGSNEDALKESSGFHVNFGYKFIKDPDFYLKGMRFAHILKGAYVKPEIAMTSYSYTNSDSFFNGDPLAKGDVLMGAVIINIGKQWIFGERFLIDWFVGGGYGFGQSEGNAYRYGFIGGGDESPLVIKGGFKIGLLF